MSLLPEALASPAAKHPAGPSPLESWCPWLWSFWEEPLCWCRVPGSGLGRGKDRLFFKQQCFFKEAAYFISKVEARIFPRSTSVKVRLEKGHQSAPSSAVSCLGSSISISEGSWPSLQIRFSPLLRQRASVSCSHLDPVAWQSSGQNPASSGTCALRKAHWSHS